LLIFQQYQCWVGWVLKPGVVPNSDPLPDYYPPSIGRFRVRCGGEVKIRGGIRIRQSDSNFTERGNNLAGSRK